MAPTGSSEKNEEKGIKYVPMLISASLTTLTHPIQMTKVLIQVGYEPVARTPYKNIFGKQMFYLPGFTAFVQTICRRDGFFGLFRGVTPRIANTIIGGSINTCVLEYLHSFDSNDDDSITPKKPESESSFEDFLRETCHQSISRVSSTIIAYPFHVVSIRMIVQFVGKETKYTGCIQSLGEIYKEEGFSGLFAGLIPQLIGDLLTLFMFRGLTFFVNKIIANEVGDFKDLKMYTKQASQIIVSSLTYPFILVANLMSLDNCGGSLAATSHMPKFNYWVACWSKLREHRLLWRGSSIIRRTSNTNVLGPLTFGNIDIINKKQLVLM